MADIRFNFLGDTSDLQAAVGDASKSIQSFDRQATDAARKVGGVFKGVAAAAVAAAGAVAGVALATAKLSKAADGYAKDAKKIGSTAEDIQRVEGAFALLTGANVDAVQMIKTFGKGMADMRDGTGEARVAFEKLGLAADDLSGLTLPDQIALIADRFTLLRDAGEQSQVAMKLFEEAGIQIVPALNAGGAAVRKAFREIEEAGIISNETAAEAEVLQDAVELLSRDLGTLYRDALEPLIPQLIDMAKEARDVAAAARESGALADMSQWLLDVGYGAGVAAAKLAEVLGIIGKVEPREGGIFVDSEEIRAQVAEIERLNVVFSEFQRVNDEVADRQSGGMWTDSQLADLERLQSELDGAKAKLKELKAEAAGGSAGAPAVSPVGGIGGGKPDKPDDSAAKAAEEAARKAVEAQEALADAIAAVGAAVDEVAYRRMSASDQAIADAEAERESIEALAAEALAMDQITEDQRLAIIEQANEAKVQLAQELAERLAEIRQEEMAAEQASLDAAAAAREAATQERLDQIETVRQAERAALNDIIAASSSAFGAIGDLVGTVTDIKVASTEKGSQAEKDALREQWEAQTAIAILTAALNIPLSIAQAAAGPWPAAIGYMVAAGVASGAAFAGVVAKAAAGPTFHDGGMVGDELTATVRRGEVVLPNPVVRALGGPEGVAEVAAGGGGPQSITVIQKLDHRVVDAQTHRAVQRTGSPLDSALRATNPRGTGRRNPYQPRT